MKLTLITFCLSLFAPFVFSQSFEGKIVYQNTYKSKLPNVTDQQFSTMMGSVENYYVKGNSYKSDMNGKLVLWQLYNHSDNKLYSKMSNSEAVLWNDGANNDDVVNSSELHKGVADILGYKCDELILHCKSGTQKYYFSSKLALDSKLYINHLYGNWYAYLSKANAVPLKIILDNPQFSMESVATTVTPMKLDMSIFTLPAGVKTAKNPN